MNSFPAQKMEKQKSEQEYFERYGFLYGEKHLPKETYYPLHWHDYFECEIILEGCAEHRCNELQERIVPGSAYVLTYEDTHSIRALENMHIFAVRFREDLLSTEAVRLLTEKNGYCQCLFDRGELSYIRSRLENIRRQDKDGKLYKQILTVLLGELILMVLERSPAGKETPLPSLVQKTASYVRCSFREPLTLESAARKLSVTPKYLGVLFKQNMHISFHDFLNNTRLRHACQLLSTTEYSVKEIAYLSGYSSVEYFLDVFKRRMSITPTAYRMQLGPEE